eukprot:COSAG05_NODE_2221_length_3375_cov_1.818681_1_plen_122_part_00
MLRTAMTACAMASLTAATCGSVPPVYCDPTTKPPDFCPGGRPCPNCGRAQCECHTPKPPPRPTPRTPLPLPPLPDFSWDVVPRFVHCGPDYKPNVAGKPPRLPLTEIYRKMSTFPLATLEK